MALITVGGQAKHVGKTTLICNVIAVFPTFRWTAVKFTTHRHRPSNCQLRLEGPGWSLWEQVQPGNDSDTARFLAAGATRALLVEVEAANLEDACLALKRQLSPATHVLVESSSAAEFLNSDLSLLLIDPEREDSKTSARELLERADAVLSKKSAAGLLQSRLAEKPHFPLLASGVDGRLCMLIESIVRAGRH